MFQQYIEPIKTAFLFFPFVAFLFTLPYMLQQYHRYGAVLVLRTVVIYSFILYLMSAYFLTILPLPAVEKVAQLTSPKYQLVPFREFAELFQNPNVILSKPSTYPKFFLNRDFFQIVANIVMTVPFGIYLRYYFHCSVKKTVLFSFLLSLLFELTQLSGLFFVYPRPYRLADVDDLITNTLGGYLGYLSAPLFIKLLPSREKMNTVAFARSTRVSILRRLFAAGVDCTLLLLIAVTLMTVLPRPHLGDLSTAQSILLFFGWYTLCVLLYFGVGEWLARGRTPGKLLVRIKLVDTRTMGRPKLWQCVVRYGLFYLLVVPLPFVALFLLTFSTERDSAQNMALLLGFLMLMLLFIAFVAWVVVFSFAKGNRLPHGWLSKTEDVSTLKARQSKKAPTAGNAPARQG